MSDIMDTDRVEPARLPDCPFHPGARLVAVRRELNRPSEYVHEGGATHGDLLGLVTDREMPDV